MSDYCQTIAFDCSTEQGKTDMHAFIDIALRNNYDVVVRYEGCNIYIIEYNYARQLCYGNACPVWIEPEEEETIAINRNATKENNE